MMMYYVLTEGRDKIDLICTNNGNQPKGCKAIICSFILLHTCHGTETRIINAINTTNTQVGQLE